jgi:hypothetical protein
VADHVTIERTGGLAGFGGPAKVRSHGRVDLDALSETDRAQIEGLFDRYRGVVQTSASDAFRYTISRALDGVVETVDVPEAALPAAVVNAVTDELI